MPGTRTLTARAKTPAEEAEAQAEAALEVVIDDGPSPPPSGKGQNLQDMFLNQLRPSHDPRLHLPRRESNKTKHGREDCDEAQQHEPGALRRIAQQLKKGTHQIARLLWRRRRPPARAGCLGKLLDEIVHVIMSHALDARPVFRNGMSRRVNPGGRRGAIANGR